MSAVFLYAMLNVSVALTHVYLTLPYYSLPEPHLDSPHPPAFLLARSRITPPLLWYIVHLTTTSVSLLQCPGRWNGYSVPKRRQLHTGRRGNSQKTTYSNRIVAVFTVYPIYVVKFDIAFLCSSYLSQLTHYWRRDSHYYTYESAPLLIRVNRRLAF